ELSRSTLYGASKDDRLTLVTSATSEPWNVSSATVVTAKLIGLPFPPLVQGARTASQTSVGGDSGAWPSAILAVVAYGAVIGASVVAYRRLRFRLAYLLTIMPLVAVTVVLGQNVMRLLPSWT